MITAHILACLESQSSFTIELRCGHNHASVWCGNACNQPQPQRSIVTGLHARLSHGFEPFVYGQW